MTRQPKIVATLPGYTPRKFLHDGIAGITVALVALPLSIAIAIASGAPPAAGLFTAIVAGFLISALGGSRVQVGGPTGAFIVVVYGVIHDHGFDGLLFATLMAGAILMIAGFMRAGRFIRMIPDAVIEGFTIGIAVVIAVSQFKELAGMGGGALPAEFIPKIEGLWALRDSIGLPSLGLGIATFIAIIVLRRIWPIIPWPLVVIALASVYAGAILPSVETVGSRFGELPGGLPIPRMPDFPGFDQVRELLPAALIIAFLAGVESLLSAIVADRLIEGEHRPNAELIAQGAANLASPLFGGLPATGAIARTATNVNAGGRTPIAGIIHALVIWLVLALAAPLAGKMAMPALAGLLMVTAWTMSEPHRWPARLALPRGELWLLLLTAFLTIFADLTVAIAVGTLIGIAMRRETGDDGDGPPRWHTPFRWGGMRHK